MTTTSTKNSALVPATSTLYSLRTLAHVVLPVVARGAIVRRPLVVALAERTGADTRAVAQMQRLRDRYGPGPLLLPNPVRPQAVILAPEHVHRVLDGSPEPFATASSEKRAALAHFQPKGSLISHGPERTVRRRFNEAVLDTPRPVHRLAERFVPIVGEEAERLLAQARHRWELTWDEFSVAWFRVVRRVVLGDAARDDHELSDLIVRLRSDAN